MAEAGLFNFLGKILGSDGMAQVSEMATVPNSQTAVLLQPVLNPTPVVGLGGGEISIVNGMALLADIGPLGSIADIEANIANPDRISLYVVRQGDSLSEIAKMFGVSVNTIVWANDISRGDLIKAGQTLIILPVTGLTYTVKAGDTAVSIAKKFSADVGEIISFNNLPSKGSLTAGETIIIPDGEVAYVSSPSPSVAYSVPLKGTQGPSYVGFYLRPIEGGVKSQGLHGYNGVDLATDCGAPILASASGDVVVARSTGWNGGYGNYVVITHLNGTQTLYAHASSLIVGAGWHVVKGQVIGYVGTTGKSTGCHLHFEVRGAKNPL